MDSTFIYKEVLKDFEQKRFKGANERDIRRQQIYELIPEVRTIDSELTRTGVNLARIALQGKGNDALQQLRATNEQLQQRKQNLIVELGFPANYIDDIAECKKCQDTGFINNTRCTCLRQALITKYYNMSTIGDIISKENFDTFDISYYSDTFNPNYNTSPRQRIALIQNACFQFIKNFDSGAGINNIMLTGQAGRGKTFLCNCIAKDVLDANHTVLYVTAPNLFKKVEEFRFNRDEVTDDYYMDFLLEVDLLIIDDLGTEFSSTVTRSELFNIINSRILSEKRTVISTNLSLSDIADSYSDRIASRIIGNYTSFEVIGDDIRLLKKHKNI